MCYHLFLLSFDVIICSAGVYVITWLLLPPFLKGGGGRVHLITFRGQYVIICVIIYFILSFDVIICSAGVYVITCVIIYFILSSFAGGGGGGVYFIIFRWGKMLFFLLSFIFSYHLMLLFFL